MNEAFLKTFKHFLAGVLASAWNGGIGAMAGIIGNDGAAVAGVGDVHVLSFRGMLSVFLGACALHAIFWLKAHPLPETYDESAPFFPVAKNTIPKDVPSKLPEIPTT